MPYTSWQQQPEPQENMWMHQSQRALVLHSPYSDHDPAPYMWAVRPTPSSDNVVAGGTAATLADAFKAAERAMHQPH